MVARAQLENSESVSFTLVGPPQGKKRARVFADNRTGKIRACTPKETTQYEQAIKLQAWSRRGRAWSLDARYSLRIVVAFGDNRRRDIDNILKSVADGCIGVLWQDDSQVHHMAVTRVFDGVPRTEVTVEVLP
jgi:Holliday junction resolvase RusA-like endonuclease